MRGYALIGLNNPKIKENVGGVVRAAHCYEAAGVVIAKGRYRRTKTDAMKGYRHTPVFHCDDLKNFIPHDCIPVAVDFLDGATSLPEYKHPERAFYIFGAEDETLENPITEWCRDKVFVPTNQCMNLAACVNIVLYDRMSKNNMPKYTVILTKTVGEFCDNWAYECPELNLHGGAFEKEDAIRSWEEEAALRGIDNWEVVEN